MNNHDINIEEIIGTVVNKITELKLIKNENEVIINKYNHMGALICDCVLQSGLNYRNVVYPRVMKLYNRFPYLNTTTEFIIIFEKYLLNELIDWKGNNKLERIKKVSYFLFNNKIETEGDLCDWLINEENISLILNIKGIGKKTLDYMRLLIGIDAIPIDRHLYNFLNEAGYSLNDYDLVSNVYSKISKKLSINKSVLDKLIWNYMANRN